MQTKRHGNRFSSAQNALAFYVVTLLYVLAVCLLTLLSFAPLLALRYLGDGSPNVWWALLCPVLVIFVLLPLRFSFAQALSRRYHGEAFSFQAAFSPSLYGEKLAEGVIYVLHMIKWAIPLGAAGVVLYTLYMNTDAFSLIAGITDFGAAITALWQGFLQLFGGAQNTAAGGIMEGLFAILGIVGLCVLLLLLGVMRNSAYRYIWAEATELEKNPHFEARRSLRGRRWKQLGVAMISLLLLAPALIMLYRLMDPKQTIEVLSTQYADALVTQSALPAITIPYGQLAVVLFVWFLPLLPIRRMITAYFATARIRHQLQTPEQAPPSANGGAQIPPLYEDKPAAPARHKPQAAWG